MAGSHTLKLKVKDSLSKKEFVIEQLTIVILNPCLVQPSSSSLDEQQIVSPEDFMPVFNATINGEPSKPVQFTKETYRLKDETNGVDCGPLEFITEVENMPPWFDELFTVDTKAMTISMKAPVAPLPNESLSGFLVLKV